MNHTLTDPADARLLRNCGRRTVAERRCRLLCLRVRREFRAVQEDYARLRGVAVDDLTSAHYEELVRALECFATFPDAEASPVLAVAMGCG